MATLIFRRIEMKRMLWVAVLMWLCAGCSKRVWQNPYIAKEKWGQQYMIDNGICSRIAYQSVADGQVASLPLYANAGAFMQGFAKAFNDAQERRASHKPDAEETATYKAVYEGCMAERGWFYGKVVE